MRIGGLILIGIWSLLLVQPLYARFCSNPAGNAHSPAIPGAPSCCKKKCQKPEPVKDQNDCDNSGCNPLMSCPSGNFFLHDSTDLPDVPVAYKKQTLTSYNDNRIIKFTADCWRPPRLS